MKKKHYLKVMCGLCILLGASSTYFFEYYVDFVQTPQTIIINQTISPVVMGQTYLYDTGVEIITLPDQKQVAEICINNLSIGCAFEGSNRIFLWNLTKKEACNHEMLHLVLKMNSTETTWGESEEHQTIFKIERDTRFPECEML